MAKSHRQWKGHCLMCALNSGKVRGQDNPPVSVMRALGKKRRFANQSEEY